jgi:hypothetical protein
VFLGAHRVSGQVGSFLPKVRLHKIQDTPDHQQQPTWLAACSFAIFQQPSRKACVARGGATASGSDQAHAEDAIAAHRADHRVHG